MFRGTPKPPKTCLAVRWAGREPAAYGRSSHVHQVSDILPGVKQCFAGFDRNSYLATFQAGKLSFLLLNVHQFFGYLSDHRPMWMEFRTA